MMNKPTALSLLLATAACFNAYADQNIAADLLVTGISDGSAPAYDCSAATLPFIPTSGQFGVDPSVAIGVIPAGEPLMAVVADVASCDFSAQPYQCSFSCEPVSAAACIGLDCVNGELLNPGELRLKENNLRIRLTNTQVTAQAGSESVFGDSWNIEANSSANGGRSYLDFQVKSQQADNLLSDGTAKAYDCDDLAVTKHDANNPPSIGLVPFGQAFFQPRVDYSSCEFSNGFKCLHTCEINTQPRPTTASVLTLGTGVDGNVAIGHNRDFSVIPEQGIIALGHGDLKRQLRHVADAVNTADLVNVRGLKFTRLEAIQTQLQDLDQTLDALELRIDAYEASLTEQVALSVDGERVNLDLSKSQWLHVDNTRFDEPWGPRAISFGFTPVDGIALDGLTVVDDQGNRYPLSAWWQVIERPLNPDVVSLTVEKQPGRLISVQWWYQW